MPLRGWFYAFVVMLGGATAGSTHAANYYWDTNNTADNGVQDGGGSWQNSSLATLRFLLETTPGVVPTSGTNVKWFNTATGLQNTVTFGAGGTGGTVNIGSSSGANGPAALGITIGPTTTAYSFTGASTSGTATFTLGAGGITMAAGASATNFDATRLVIALSGSGGSTTALTNNSANKLTIDAPISGANGISKSGVGLVSLGGNSTFAGGLTIAQGSLAATSAAALGSGGVTVASGATLTVLAPITNAITNAGTVNVGAGGGVTAGSLGGALVLTGALGTAATFTDTLSGTLALASLSANGDTTISLAGGSRLAASGPVSFTGDNNLLTLTGGVLGSGTYTLIQGATLTGTSGLSVAGSAIGGGSVALGGSATIGRNTYTFSTTASALQLGVTGTLFNLTWNGGASGAWNMTDANWQQDGTGPGIQFVANDNVTFGTAAAVAVAADIAAGTVTVNGESGTVAFSGSGGISALSIAKSGAGTASIANRATISGGIAVSGGKLLLSAANTVNGGVTLTGGTLAMAVTNAFGTGTATINGGTLVATTGGISVAGPIVVGAAGGTVNDDGPLTLGGAILGGGTNATANVLTKTGSGTLTIAGSLGATKAGVQVNVADGSLVLSGAAAKEFGGMSTFAGGVSATNQTINLSQNSGFAGSGQLLLDGGSINGVFNSSGGSATIANPVSFTNAVAVVGSSSKNLAFTGAFSGSGTITTSGGGKVSFVAATDGGFAGSLVVSHTSSGGYTEASTQALGGASSVVVNANPNRMASVNLNIANASQDDFTGVISGAGIVGIASGTNRAVLSGTNTYTGGTLLSGDVGIRNPSALGTGPLTAQGSAARVWWDGDTASVTLGNALSTGTAATSVLAFAGSGKTIVLTGSVAGSGQLKVSGGADLDFRQIAANTSTGGIEVGTGRILTDGAKLGSGPINFGTGSNSVLVATANLTLTNAFTAASSSSVGYTATFDTNGHAVTVASALNDKVAGQAKGANLNKIGAGLLTLTGSSGYTGTTTVTSGTLALGSNGSITTSSGVVVAAGATFDVEAIPGGYAPAGQTLSGAGTVAGAMTIGGDATLAPGAGLGTLTVTQGLTWAGGGNYNWQILNATGTSGDAGGWDLASVGGVLDIAATAANPFTLNLWSLSGIGPEVSGSASNFDPTRDSVWKIASAGGGITGFSADKFRVVTSAANGAGGFANDLAGGTFSVAQNGKEIDLVFRRAPPLSVVINVASGTQTQGQAGSSSFSGTTPVEKTGAGTFVLNQANALTGPTTVSQGTLQLGNAGALGSSPVTVAAGATLAVGPQVQATIPSLVNNGLVDVGLGTLTVTTGLTGDGVAAAILAVLGGGTSGITSSAAAATPFRAVGWLDNGDGSVTFGFAAEGDSNLDGLVDVGDLQNILASGKYGTGAAAVWADGDFNFDGVVDVQDLQDILASGLYGQGGYNNAPLLRSMFASARFGGELLAGPAAGLSPGSVAAVPEPSAGMLVLLGAVVGARLVSRARRGFRQG